jgi:hypothetical protein
LRPPLDGGKPACGNHDPRQDVKERAGDQHQQPGKLLVGERPTRQQRSLVM